MLIDDAEVPDSADGSQFAEQIGCNREPNQQNNGTDKRVAPVGMLQNWENVFKIDVIEQDDGDNRNDKDGQPLPATLGFVFHRYSFPAALSSGTGRSRVECVCELARMLNAIIFSISLYVCLTVYPPI